MRMSVQNWFMGRAMYSRSQRIERQALCQVNIRRTIRSGQREVRSEYFVFSLEFTFQPMPGAWAAVSIQPVGIYSLADTCPKQVTV